MARVTNKVGRDLNPHVKRNIKAKPILNRLVVKYDKQEQVSSGGIILGDVPKHEHPDKSGTVISVGEGNFDKQGNRIPMTVKEGDRIMFTGISGVSIGEETLIITEEDVLVILS